MEMQNPFSAPQVTEAAVIQPAMFPRHYGGIGRLAYFGGYVGIAVVHFLAGFLLPLEEPAMFMLSTLAILALQLALTTLRLQNQGMSGWLTFLVLVPIANFVIFVRCLAFPEGYQDTRRLDTAGKAVVGILLVGMVLMVAAVVLLALSFRPVM